MRWGQGAEAGGEPAEAGRAGRTAAEGCSALKSLSPLLFLR